MAYRIGIDAGSKTIKVVVLDQDDDVVYRAYRRHRSNIVQTLKGVLRELQWKRSDIDGPVAFTGSAGIGIAEEVGAPFVQEVVATTTAVQQVYPQADAVIELGGEDAKVIYLTGGVEQRMNASCAGGTGGFIDTVAHMLGVRVADMDALARECRHFYPIASRCAVFAQTDVRPLVNAGVSKADLAGSVFRAVVRQTLGGLACGRPLRGTVVFLGGPLAYNDALVALFREELGLTEHTGIKPKDAHLLTARGAANSAGVVDSCTLRLSQLKERLDKIGVLQNDLERLPPLFQGAEELRAFRKRHASCVYPQAPLANARGPLYLGIDAGSTTVKIAVLDQAGRLVHQQYEQAEGDIARTLRTMLGGLYKDLSHRSSSEGQGSAWIAQSAVTGYGEALARALFGVDAGVVETAAHVRAAREICPEVSFVLDIGGQDMKALWVEDGIIVDAVLNEACSSGCGSFVEGTAYSLRSAPEDFADMALWANEPVDLGTRCTVFMTSRVRHAQKAGAQKGDIAAGIAYSVIQNALYRIIGTQRLSSLGESIVVQGGAFKSDAVLRAFELMAGRQVTRCDQSHLMGAIGAALIAHDKADEMKAVSSECRNAASSVEGAALQSGLDSFESISAMEFRRESLTCGGCANACPLSVISTSNGRAYLSGNRCSKGLQAFKRGNAATPREGAPVKAGAEAVKAEAADPPNVFAQEQELLSVCDGAHEGTTRASVNIGLMNALELYGTVPFWRGALSALGFTVTVDPSSVSDVGKSPAWETIPSESVCYPAKLTHVRYFNLRQQGVNAVFMPQFERRYHCMVASSYGRALADNLPLDAPPLLLPELSSYDPRSIVEEECNHKVIKQVLEPFARESGVPLGDEELRCAMQAGLAEQQRHDDAIRRATADALAWVAASPPRRGIVLAGHPYHGDPAVAKGIDVELRELGVAVLSMRGLNQCLRGQGPAVKGKDPIDPRSWRPAKRLRSVAEYVAGCPQLDLVCLQSFGCGYDAVSFEEVCGILAEAGKPFTVLKIDDVTDLAHVRIRLRTLIDGIEKRSADSVASKGVAAFRAGAGRSGVVQGAAMGLSLSLEDASIGCNRKTIRRSTVKDVCFTAQAMAAHVIEELKANPLVDTVELPLVCKDCLLDAVPSMVERAVGRQINVKWTKLSNRRDNTGATRENKAEEPCARIGIVGNGLLCYQPALNDDLAGFLASLDVQAVLPDPALIQGDDVRYEEQLARYEQEGITEVIYVQSFGCLKGHVQSRGALHELKRMFPSLNITVIDYDPEGSALNRENRVRLVVETLKQRGGKAPLV